MKNKEEHLEALSEIRSMMERSSRFISLSGLSGVFAGFIALIGVFTVYLYAGINPFSGSISWQLSIAGKLDTKMIIFLATDAFLVLVLAVGAGIYFTVRNAKRKNLKIWDRTTELLLANLFVPLAVGGIFCIILFYHGIAWLIVPSTLIFYGLALLNASKYTFTHIRSLALVQIVLGLISAFFTGYGLLFWGIGFGIFHILYGIYMYIKHERHN